MVRRPVLPVWLLITAIALPGYTQFYDAPQTGEAAAAEKYLDWAEAAVQENRWALAEEALERAADYSGVSSDLSYLLALARSHQNRPRGAVLEALRRALEADRWGRYTPDMARLLEAETLIAIRAFSGALQSLALTGESAGGAALRLLALKGLPNIPEFQRLMARSLERYPWDPRLVRILFEYAAPRFPDETDRELLALALRRLPLLLEADPALAYLAVPFIRDTEEARRLAAAYRAARSPLPASIPTALKLGLIDEIQAVDELFQIGAPGPGPSGGEEPRIDKALLLSILALLRNQEGQDYFLRNLSRFSGVIIEDRDMDGYIESAARYQGGMVRDYFYDADQDGLAELELSFAEGVPSKAELVVLPERPSPDSEAGSSEALPFAYPVKDADRSKAALQWGQYPAVSEVALDGVRYIARPAEFFFAPIRFAALAGTGPSSFLYPEREPLPRLSKRTLVSFSLIIERPGRNFKGALERVELDRGVPRRALELVDGRIAGRTEFLLGQPRVQRIDLDLDGRLETIRRFRVSPLQSEDPLNYPELLESSESDWDGDGLFEYEEKHLEGTIIRSWDMDGDGIKEYTETNARN
ncbi:MAG: hypothetical protein LBP93_06825 [Treponema sp.]|jgi:hypothetical protein|nr:hypothetical protein [Treponema sp.]